MAEITKIQWTDHTFNPWIGCSKVHAGCTHCYAEADMDHRRGRVKWGPHGTRSRTSESYWRGPIKWNKAAQSSFATHHLEPYVDDSDGGGPECQSCHAPTSAHRQRVFCGSLCDVFEDWKGTIIDHEGEEITKGRVERYVAASGAVRMIQEMLTMDDLRAELFALIDATPFLTWQLLTKRPENVLKMWAGGRRENVWLGTSISDQETADAAIPNLHQCRGLASKLFLSAEPLLGTIRLQHDYDGEKVRNWLGEDSSIDWVIIGGESGNQARECRVGWIRDLKDECQENGVACFVKQLGKVTTHPAIVHAKGGDPSEWPSDLRVREFPE